MSQGPPENQPARTTNPSQAHQGTAVFNPQGEMSSGTVPPTSSTGAPASAQAQQRTAPLGSRTGAQPRSETSNTIPPRPITGTPALARAQQSTASSGSRTGAQPRSETSNTIPPRPRTGAQQSIATSGSRTGAQPQSETSNTIPPRPRTGTPASARAQQSTASSGSRTGAQPRSETSNAIPPRPITGTPALARAQQSTASSGSRTGAQPRSETSNTIPPRPRTGAQQSIATSGSRTGAQPQSETSNTIPPRPRTGTPASARAQQSTASSGSRIGAQPRSETSNTIPLRPSTDTSTLDQVQQSIASSGSRTGAQPRSETSNTIPPRPRTGTPASARAQQSTASSGSRTGAQPRSETSNTIPPRPITGAQQSIATSGSRTGAQAQSETSNTIPPKPSTGTPASSVNFAQGATSNTTPGTISPDTRLEDISSPRQPPQVPRRRVVPSTLTSRPPNRSATQATEHVSSFQRQGSEESHDDTSSESSYESVSSRAVTGIRQQMPPRSVNPSTDVGLSGTLGVTAAPPTAPSVGQPALSDQDRGHTINFRDGARSPHSMHLEDIPGVANRGFIWVANNGDQQLRVRKIQSSDESVNPNVITLEVQSVSNFRPLHFFMRLLYVYSIFQLCVFIVILTLSLLHQIGAGVILGKLTEILKIPLFIQVIHVVSHLFCIMNRVFLDIFSNFQYIRYWLPSKGTGSQHDKEVLCDRLFALTLVWCPVFTLGVNVFRGSGWSDAVSHTQLVSILGAGLICFVYFIEQIWTTWFIIRKLRKIRNGDVDGSVVRRNCCHRIRDCCHRIVNSVVLIVEQRLTYSLSSIRTEAIDSGQQSDDHVDFESFPNLVKFLYVEPDFHEITTVTEMTYAEVIPTQPRRPLTQIVDHDGRPDMVSTLSNASSLDDDDEEMANQDGRASMSNCFGFRARWISNLTIFLELVIVLCIIGSFIMLLIAMYKSLGASAASILPTVILVIATLYKLGVGDRCANLIPSNPTSGMSHLYWILCPVDTGAVVRDSGLFDIVCSEIRHRCGWRSSAATTGVRRTWMAKPKGIVIWSIFWVCILVSVGCTVAFVQMIKTEIEGEDRRNWVWLALGIGFFSFVFFVLDPEGWVYLSRREDFKDAFLKNKNNDGTQTSTTTSVPAKAHHRLEILSWMRKQRLIYALMVFVSGCYGLALYTMYENMESIDAETTNLRVQSLGAEGGREVLGYCNVQTVWNASEDVGLSLVDFGVLAALAYEPQSDDTKDVLTAWFNYSSSRVTLWESSAYPEACGRPGATTRLFDVVPSSGGPPRTVLSIRGTVDFKDWFEDIALWGPVMIADIAAQILPFGTSWESVIPEFLRATRILNAGSYANELMDCVRELKSNVTARNSRLYLTGHSLGGGLASLLGARENVPNAVFSAPGSELSIGLLAEDKLDELRRNTINVIPDGDLVPQVDRSAFHAQKIECTDESLLRPIECHGIVRTVNTLAELCGASHRLLKESEIPP